MFSNMALLSQSKKKGGKGALHLSVCALVTLFLLGASKPLYTTFFLPKAPYLRQA